MKRNPAAAKIVELLIRRAIRKSFHAVRVAGAANLPPDNEALIFCANHTNWWDGFVAVLLGRLQPGTRTFVWQEAAVLQRYRFFELAGAVPIDLRNPQAALGGVRSALQLLKSPGTSFWLFPQGILTSSSQPVEIRKGALLLARRSGCAIQPVAFRWHWLAESRPTIFIRFGTTLRTADEIAATGDTLQSLVEQIDRDVETLNLADYQNLVPPGVSINAAYDRIRSLFTRK